MAYSNVKIPRFYIDEISNLKKMGMLTSIEDKDLQFIGLENCNLQKDATGMGGIAVYKWQDFDIDTNSIYYNDWDIGKLGVSSRAYFGTLNFNSVAGVSGIIADNNSLPYTMDNAEPVINSTLSGSYNIVGKNGFTITTGDISEWIRTETTSAIYQKMTIANVFSDSLGCFTFGFYYDMPFAPDLNMQMLTEFDGFSNIKTISGKTITQANYMGKPWWYDINGNKVEPWSLYDGDANHGLSKRNGRRVWKLNFKYMSDSDLFSSNLSNTYHLETSTGYNDSDYVGDDTVTIFTKNIATDDSFQAAVLNRISNGERFIFQADKDSRNPSDFAICILDGSDFSIRQSAINVYDINMTIREVW